MRVTLLKSKIHRATVTGASLDYEGSITVPARLAALAGLFEFEKVLVADVSNGSRFETYVIIGPDGEIRLNGAAARLGSPGDKVIIMAWGSFDEAEAAGFRPKVVLVNERNMPKKAQKSGTAKGAGRAKDTGNV